MRAIEVSQSLDSRAQLLQCGQNRCDEHATGGGDPAANGLAKRALDGLLTEISDADELAAERRKEAGQSEQMAARRDHPRWLEARVEGEVAKSESIVVEMGCGVRLLVANVGQAALAGEVLRAMGLGRGC